MKGIKFGNIHSYHDLNLILSSVSIPPATPKTTFVEIAGADGVIDLTEAHGEVKYNDRDSAQFVFTMNPAGDLSDYAFECKKTEVSDLLNGMYFEQIILDKDADYFYSGRCAVNSYLSDKRIRQIVVVARLKPYKYKVEETVVVRALSSTTDTIILANARKTVIPSIICSDDNTIIEFEGSTFNYNAGEHKNLNIQLKAGENTFKVVGEGTIEFRYREGDL